MRKVMPLPLPLEQSSMMWKDPGGISLTLESGCKKVQ